MNIVWNDAAYVGNGIACLPTGTTAVFVNLKTQKLEGQVDFSSKAPNIETALSTLAAGEGAVWISAYNGTATLGKRTLIQIDPTAKKIGKTLDFTWDANGSDGLLAANGYVWISKQDSTKVIRVDPQTVKQVDEIELGGVAHVVDGPGEMAHGAGAVWVADFAGNRICRIDDTTTAVACIDLGHSPNDLTVEQ
jgi:streptogramin lyase